MATKADINNPKVSIESVSTLLQELKKEVKQLITDVNELKKEVKHINTETAGVKKGDLEKLEEATENTSDHLSQEIQAQTLKRKKCQQNVEKNLSKKIKATPRDSNGATQVPKNEKANIQVQGLDHQILSLNVSPADTVMDVKTLVEAEVATPAQELILFEKKTLNDRDTLQTCGVKQGSTLYIGVKIQVQGLDHQTLTLNVLPADTVWDVKTLVQAKVAIPAQELILLFEKKTLNDRDTLQTCGVKQGSTLYIEITVTVKVSPSSTISLAVSAALSVKDVKKLIEAEVPDVQQGLLLCNNQQFEDDAELSKYTVRNGDTLMLPSALSVQEMAKAMKEGMKVKRGRDWRRGDNDDGGGLGTVIRELYQLYGGGGQVRVRWDRPEHEVRGYAMGLHGQYHLQLA